MDQKRWRVCVRSFTLPSTGTNFNTDWIELRLHTGGCASVHSSGEDGFVSHIVPIADETLHHVSSETWFDNVSVTPRISVRLLNANGGDLFYEASDKSISAPGEWALQLELQPM